MVIKENCLELRQCSTLLCTHHGWESLQFLEFSGQTVLCSILKLIMFFILKAGILDFAVQSFCHLHALTHLYPVPPVGSVFGDRSSVVHVTTFHIKKGTDPSITQGKSALSDLSSPYILLNIYSEHNLTEEAIAQQMRKQLNYLSPGTKS